MEETQLTPDEPQPRSNFKRVILPIVIILALVVAGLLAIKASVNRNHDGPITAFELMEGANVPNFTLHPLGKTETVELSSLKHKVMMVNFWATWCEACMVEMPSIVALRNQFASRGFEVLGINVDENPVQATESATKQFNITFPLYTDTDGSAAELFDVHAIPLTVIFNQDKKVLFVESGERDWNSEEVQKMMEKWLSE
jgi:peroxiredoxin